MENDYFETKDTNLAAYLLCCGANYIETRKDETHCVFLFSEDEKTTELLNNFRSDTWLKNYNINKKFCIKTIRNIKSQNICH